MSAKLRQAGDVRGEVEHQAQLRPETTRHGQFPKPLEVQVRRLACDHHGQHAEEARIAPHTRHAEHHRLLESGARIRRDAGQRRTVCRERAPGGLIVAGLGERCRDDERL